MEMKRSWLIQRLKKPYGKIEKHDSLLQKFVKSNPFAFGGGLINGGLSKEAMGLLSEIFSFDYMGSAEFEWGAVPKALHTMVNRKDLIAYKLDIKFNETLDFHNTGKKLNGKVFVIAPKEYVDEVDKRIKHFALNDYSSNRNYSTKEGVELNGALNALLLKDNDKRAYRRDLCGWLELDNGYMFFIDENMFKKVVELFGLETLS